MTVVNPQDVGWVEILSAVSTAIAAIFAAWSAYASMRSARAATEAVEEARLARRAELAPKLVLEKEFLDLIFYWSHVESSNGGVVAKARKNANDTLYSAPTFSLQNFGQSPGLEVTIVWELEDSLSDVFVPPHLTTTGLSVGESVPDSSGEGAIKVLRYPCSDGTSTGLPLYRRWTTDLPSCSPGQVRSVEFPYLILNTVFLRGLQRGASAGQSDLVLTATVSCHSVDDIGYQRVFKWKVVPFHHGRINPIEAFSHIHELPVLPKPSGPRVA